MAGNRLISELSDREHEEFRGEVQAFVKEYLVGCAGELEAKEEFPWKAVKEMGRRGWMGIPIPKEYGGAGLDNLNYFIAIEEISRVCGSTGITLAAHTSLVVCPLFTNGTEAQKKQYPIPWN